MFDDEGCDLDRVFSWVASLVNPLPDQRIRVALGAGYSRATALLPNIKHCRCQSVSSQWISISISSMSVILCCVIVSYPVLSYIISSFLIWSYPSGISKYLYHRYHVVKKGSTHTSKTLLQGGDPRDFFGGPPTTYIFSLLDKLYQVKKLSIRNH